MIVAERILRIKNLPADILVPVRIELPYDDDAAWACEFSIGWPNETLRGRALGVDSYQALSIAIRRIAVHLYASPYHHAGTLSFDDDMPGYGFPLGSSDQTIPVGRDRDW